MQKYGVSPWVLWATAKAESVTLILAPLIAVRTCRSTSAPLPFRFRRLTTPASSPKRRSTSILRTIYRSSFFYQKTGILLTDLISIHQRQPDLFEDVAGLASAQSLMTAIDRINRMMGRRTIKLLAEGMDQRWAMKAGKRTPRYTTRLDELPVVKMAKV